MINLPRISYCRTIPATESGAILLIADLLHPLHRLPLQLLLNGNMRHRRRGGRAVPVLLARREPDHVAGPDFLARPALALRPAAARRHDQRLAQRVRVPRRPGAW